MIYVICCTSRSGSSYLCKLLESTNLLGFPHEHFNDAVLVPGIDSKQHFEQVLKEYRTPNGVFGSKVVPASYIEYIKHYPIPDKHIFLYRSDIIAQAISLYKAMETGWWCWYPNTAAMDITIGYDFKAIYACRKVIIEMNQQWKQLFDDNGIQSLDLQYENYYRQPRALVQLVADYLEIGLPRELEVTCPYQIQRDAVTDLWTTQFTSDLAKLSLIG